jgi:alpha-mannosidase
MQELGFDDKARGSENLVALNTLPWSRSEMIKMPILSDTPKYCLGSSEMGVGTVSPLIGASSAAASIKETKKGVYELANSRFKVEIADGVITSLYDKAAKREVIAKGGKANQLVIFDDKPLYWQAWDVEVFHLESRKVLTSSSSKILEHGPHRVSVVIETRISDESWVKTIISLSATTDDSSAAVEIEAEVEWKESMKFLKVEFPVDIVNTEASYETQYGIVRRPTHYNTTWDMAKFEVCCHKWADLSEAGYGVSILNDSKYGFATCGNLMRLSLLRAPKAPDAHADMGELSIASVSC